MHLAGVGAGDIGVQLLYLMGKPMRHQKIQRPVGHRWGRPQTVLRQPSEHIIGPHRLVFVQQDLQRPATHLGELQLRGRAMCLRSVQRVGDAGAVIMFGEIGHKPKIGPFRGRMICYNVTSRLPAMKIVSLFMSRSLTLAAALSILPLQAMSEAPNVASDIAPVHALVAQVMGGVGAPDLLIPATQSPHNSSLKPSDAAIVQEADIVFIIGSELTPWLADRIATLSPEARVVDLLDHAVVQRSYAEDGEGHDDHADHADHDDHADHEDHDDHADHADHDDHADHEGHAEHEEHAEHEAHADHKEHDDHEDHAEHEGHEGHDHDGLDPHAWLNPRNAEAWLGIIAEELSKLDPDNAEQYRDAALMNSGALRGLADEVTAKLAPFEGQKFLAYHDAYGYFTDRFGVVSAGSLASNEGAAPSAADMRRAQDLIGAGEVACVFTEPQYNAKSLQVITESSRANVVELDPLGARHLPGPALYASLINDMATAFETCLSKPG